MSDCGVCLSSDMDDCDGSIDDVSIVILDHDQRCSACRQVFQAGTRIEQADWYDDGWNYDEDRETTDEDRKDPIYTCLICAEIAEAFYCNGRMYGTDLWDELSQVADGLNTACFDRLTTPEAKAYLRERWIKWKGLAS